jgi:deoxyribodipyrimidine photo-lyase
MRVFWHRRDLRTHDNVGLSAAASGTVADEVIPVYVYDKGVLSTIGDRQRAFILRGVKDLKQRYKELGTDLMIRSGTPEEVLTEVANEYNVDSVYYNKHYRKRRRNRAQEATASLDENGVSTESLTDLVLVGPGRLNESYENHSRFYDDWDDVPKESPYPEPDASAFAEIDTSLTVPDVETEIDLPEAGHEAARERLGSFCAEGIYTYNDTRDDLSAAVEDPTSAVSRMSPYISAGMVGIREVWEAATEIHRSVEGRQKKNIGKYRYELSWREHNYHLLYHNPSLPVENYKHIPNEIRWRNDTEDFEAWKRGETGYPLVDAGMRQLRQEGYIHNRPRQVVASFLTKHLLVDWREGADHFRDLLIDHDYASNYGNWQWIASTGTDSVDVRIFDPVSQMSKYDPEDDFVKEYIPELREVPPEKAIEWPNLRPGERDRLAPEYPEPIVDRNEGYERAQRVFEEALGKR